MNRIKYFSYYLIVSLLYIIGCKSTFQVSSTQTKTIYPEKQTFAVAKDEKVSLLLGEQTMDELEKEIVRQMKTRGFIHTVEKPDLIVFVNYYNQKVKLPELEKIDNKEETGANTVIRSAGTNTLIIQLLDVTNNETVWRAYASNLPQQTQTRQFVHVTKWLFSELKFQKVVDNPIIANVGSQ